MLCYLHVDRLKASLNYNEEVYQSRNLGEHSNMIGHEMGSSLTTVYSTTKTSQVENFKHGWKIDIAHV